MKELKVRKRDILGSKTRKLRSDGLIPAELYGHGIENIHLSVPIDAFSKVYKEAGTHSIVTVDVEGDKRNALVNGVQIDPVSQEVLSIDFHQIRMDEKVRAHIPLEFEGEPPAVEAGGVLVKSMDEIEVEALPADLPHSVVVDLSGLTEFDQSIYVKDLPKSGKFEFTMEPDNAVVSVSAPREEEKEEAPEGEISPEDVVVEGEEKRPEKEGEKSGEEEKHDKNETKT